MRRLLLTIFLVTNCNALIGQTTGRNAPGAPGGDAHWESAAKNGFGTSASRSSRVWFTLARGVMTEVFYPTLDVPNVQLLQLIVVRGKNIEIERDDMIHRLDITDSNSLAFRQVNTSRQGAYSIRKTYVTDPRTDTVLIDLQYSSRGNSDVYVFYDPSLNNSGLHDSAWSWQDSLLARDADVATALVSDCGIEDGESTNGFLGASDGLTQLRKQRHLTTYDRAVDGNVVQVARLTKLSGNRQLARCTLALGFGADEQQALRQAHSSLRKGFNRVRRDYDREWRRYVSKLPRVEPRYQSQLNMSAMVLKALEDKTHPGAMIASPSNPWGAGPNANESSTTGYHAVWARDLYHVATAFIALGDRASANRALNYLFRVQQQADGSFPQNSRVDGRPIGTAVQMDQVAYSLILAYQLSRNDSVTWRNHLKPAADFIMGTGPATEQERWEEERGYSPSTIAAEIAGLVCAADIARVNRDLDSATAYLEKADEWASKVESWTATSTGRYGHYYLRVTENDNPNDGAILNINSGGGDHDERDIVDAGFLELVRLGIRRADNPLIKKSLEIVDRLIKIETPNGSAWYRYNQDAYGEREDGSGYDGRTGKGRPWPLLTGERGEYEISQGDIEAARRRLDNMLGFANDGRMLPEQIWNERDLSRHDLRSGEGTGSATPLGWAMAQFIRLAINIRQARNIETPPIVSSRYQMMRR